MSYVGNTPTTQAFTPAVDYFSGNGSTTAFTLSRPVASVAQVQVAIENVPQNPGDAFTVSGNTITFTSAPPSGTNNIYVYYTSPITQVIAPSQGTVGTSALVDSAVTTAKIADSAITTAKIAAGAVVQADLATGVAGTGPAFRAYKSAASQTLSNITNTKVVLDVEAYDTASCFNNTASTVGGIPAYAFLPNVAGYYQFNATVYAIATSGLSYNFLQFFKNGAQDAGAVYGPYNTTSQIGSVSALIYLNGTTDYVELYGQISGTGTLTISNGSALTYFNGFLARAA